MGDGELGSQMISYGFSQSLYGESLPTKRPNLVLTGRVGVLNSVLFKKIKNNNKKPQCYFPKLTSMYLYVAVISQLSVEP